MSINDRLVRARKKLNLSQGKVAEKLGISQSAVATMEKEGSTVTEQNIKSYCSIFGVNEEWLVSEKGDMFTNKRQQDVFLGVFDQLMPEMQEHIIKVSMDLLLLQNKLKMENKLSDANDNK